MTTKYIFDLDETITKTNYQYEEVFFKSHMGEDAKSFLPRKYELLMSYEKLYKKYDVKNLSDHFANYGFNIPPYVIEEWTDFKGNVEAIPEMASLIVWLADQKKKLILLSNWFTKAQKEKLHRVGLLSYFDTIIGGDYALKPNPESFELAIGQTPIEDCIMIGDDYEKDFLGAIQMGLSAYHVTDKNRNEIIRKLRLK